MYNNFIPLAALDVFNLSIFILLLLLLMEQFLLHHPTENPHQKLLNCVKDNYHQIKNAPKTARKLFLVNIYKYTPLTFRNTDYFFLV